MALGLGSGTCSAAVCCCGKIPPSTWEGRGDPQAGPWAGGSRVPGISASHPPLQHCSFSCLALGMSCGLSNPCLLLYSQATVNIAQLRHPRYQ